MAKHNEVGRKGEDIAVKYVENKGFFVLDRNYRKKCGELDIVAKKDGYLHFFEVKTVNRKSFGGKFEQDINNYRPEDNMHYKKIMRLKRTIQSYLLDKNKKDSEWLFSVVCVFLDIEKKVAKIKIMENIIL